MRHELVEWREREGLTQEQLAHKLDVSVRTVHRLESGQTLNPRMSLRTRLARFYRRSMHEVNRAVRGDAINGHSVTNLGLLVSLEQGATEIRWWEPVSLCGLLQTERYALAVESAGPNPASDSEIARRVALRMQRQKVLDSLHLYALIDASVLIRETGGREVMAEQLAHLRAVSRRPNVHVRVVPLDARAHLAGTGPFKILTGEGDYPHTVVTHNLIGPHFWDVPFVLAQYEALFAHLWESCDELAQVDL